MEFFNYLENKLNRRAAAGILIVLLLLTAISSGLSTELAPRMHSTNVSISAPANSFDYTVFSAQTKADYSLSESKSVYDYSYGKKTSANNTANSLQNQETNLRQYWSSGAILLSGNVPQKCLKSSYLLADIPPPFFKE